MGGGGAGCTGNMYYNFYIFYKCTFCDSVTLAVYNLTTQKYGHKVYDRDMKNIPINIIIIYIYYNNLTLGMKKHVFMLQNKR